MTYFTKISPKLILVFGILVYFGNSCKKMDSDDLNLLEKTFAEKFFEQKVTNKKEVIAIIEELKKENENSGFVKELPANCGLPIWNKIAVQGASGQNGSTSDLQTKDYEIFIPLGKDTTLNSILVAKKIDKKYRFTYYSKDYLYKICHAKEFNNYSVANTLMLFMFMENRISGVTKFYNIPKGIFVNPALPLLQQKSSNNSETITIEAPEKDLLPNTFTQVCVTIKYCNPGNVCRPLENYCDHCSVCPWVVICHFEEIEGGGSGGNETIWCVGCTPPGGGGTGGGGNGDPCPTMVTTWYLFNAIPGCDEGGGGNPPPPPNPCDAFVNALASNTTFTTKFASLNTQAVTSLNYEKAIFAVNLNSNNYLEHTGNPSEPFINYLTINIQFNGYLHSHFTNNSALFSIYDLQFMSRMYLNNKALDSTNFFFGVTSPTGTPYLIKVTNTTKFRQFAQKMVNPQKKYERIRGRYIELFTNTPANFNEESAFLKMLNEFQIGNGATVFRGNNNCTEWSKISVDSFGDVTAYPCLQAN